ncbi:MAG: DUF924 domain-containing protein [Proteobacteria bacterium]|nr:DUF924 domain-containing protein [Pseudomonadota bacterium]
MLEKVNDILHFWFGTDKEHPLSHKAVWFKADPLFDEEIKDRFVSLHHLATQGKLNNWLDQPQSCLAYIILLDQFSRNIYRGTPLAFSQDLLALNACQHGREHKLDKELNLVQRLFFYLPLEHAEDINSQKLCLMLMKQLVQEAKLNHPELIQEMEQGFDYAQRHYDIIFNFGRFPHRNAILERESTQDELLFLNMPNNNF